MIQSCTWFADVNERIAGENNCDANAIKKLDKLAQNLGEKLEKKKKSSTPGMLTQNSSTLSFGRKWILSPILPEILFFLIVIPASSCKELYDNQG